MLSVAFLSCFLRPVAAQKNTSFLKEEETELANLFSRIYKENRDTVKSEINDSVIFLFKKILIIPGSFNYPFDSLRFVGKIYSPDSSFKLINWNLSFTNGRFKYFGFIQEKYTGIHPCRIIQLREFPGKIPHLRDTILSPSDWYGALYYDILTNTWEGKTYYTLLGIDYNDMFTTKKVIDVITFDNRGNALFGAPIFNTGENVRKRIIFEYTAEASMLLHYDKDLSMIVFDHLSPSRPGYKGLYQFYGPDFSYDGFVFHQGMWYLKKDLNIRNKH